MAMDACPSGWGTTFTALGHTFVMVRGFYQLGTSPHKHPRTLSGAFRDRELFVQDAMDTHTTPCHIRLRVDNQVVMYVLRNSGNTFFGSYDRIMGPVLPMQSSELTPRARVYPFYAQRHDTGPFVTHPQRGRLLDWPHRFFSESKPSLGHARSIGLLRQGIGNSPATTH